MLLWISFLSHGQTFFCFRKCFGFVGSIFERFKGIRPKITVHTTGLCLYQSYNTATKCQWNRKTDDEKKWRVYTNGHTYSRKQFIFIAFNKKATNETKKNSDTYAKQNNRTRIRFVLMCVDVNDTSAFPNVFVLQMWSSFNHTRNVCFGWQRATSPIRFTVWHFGATTENTWLNSPKTLSHKMLDMSLMYYAINGDCVCFLAINSAFHEHYLFRFFFLRLNYDIVKFNEIRQLACSPFIIVLYFGCYLLSPHETFITIQ